MKQPNQRDSTSSPASACPVLGPSQTKPETACLFTVPMLDAVNSPRPAANASSDGGKITAGGRRLR